MEFILDIIQVIVGILLVITILLQSSEGGLGAAFGGGETVTSTRRGAEKGLFNLSIIFSIVFLGLAAARIFIG
jgi:preprotein translocase subunit SecG